MATLPMGFVVSIGGSFQRLRNAFEVGRLALRAAYLMNAHGSMFVATPRGARCSGVSGCTWHMADRPSHSPGRGHEG